MYTTDRLAIVSISLSHCYNKFLEYQSSSICYIFVLFTLSSRLVLIKNFGLAAFSISHKGKIKWNVNFNIFKKLDDNFKVVSKIFITSLKNRPAVFWKTNQIPTQAVKISLENDRNFWHKMADISFTSVEILPRLCPTTK